MRRQHYAMRQLAFLVAALNSSISDTFGNADFQPVGLKPHKLYFGSMQHLDQPSNFSDVSEGQSVKDRRQANFLPPERTAAIRY